MKTMRKPIYKHFVTLERTRGVCVYKKLCDKVCNKRRESQSWVGLPQKPPCPFSRASYGEPGLQVPWALMSALHSTSPSQPQRLCRNLATSRQPTATSHSHLEQREETLLNGQNTNKQTARKSTQWPVLTSPTCSKHINSAKLRSLGATVTV